MSDTFTQERLLRLYTSAPKAFHRCDVDVSLSAAVKMARFAQVAGIRSTFYLNPRSDFYNLFSRDGTHAARTIAGLGHRVGLHVDCRSDEDPVERYGQDRALFDGDPLHFVLNLELVSFHMPPACVLWRDFRPHFVNAYAPEWRNRYVSDSRAEWGPEKEALVTDDAQIALHPEHWLGA